MNLDPIILAELQRGGPPLWVSGRTYPKGWEVRSLVNLQRYVRKVAGAGDTDPSADAANWEAWSKSLDRSAGQPFHVGQPCQPSMPKPFRWQQAWRTCKPPSTPLQLRGCELKAFSVASLTAARQ